MNNLYKTTYKDSLGIYREVYTIATDKQEGILLALARINELHEQETLWYRKAIAAGMTAKRTRYPIILNTVWVMSEQSEQKVGA